MLKWAWSMPILNLSKAGLKFNLNDKNDICKKIEEVYENVLTLMGIKP